MALTAYRLVPVTCVDTFQDRADLRYLLDVDDIYAGSDQSPRVFLATPTAPAPASALGLPNTAAPTVVVPLGGTGGAIVLMLAGRRRRGRFLRLP